MSSEPSPGLLHGSGLPWPSTLCLDKAHSLDGLRRMAATVALHHHEQWDGSGYPQGLAAEAIPLAGRLVAVADVFDALCSKRPYKEAMAPDQAFAEIVRGRGSHFDPQLVDIFIDNRAAVVEVMKMFAPC